MQAQVKPRKVDFKFGLYISQAIDLMKKDFGTIFLSLIFAVILGIIPFCGIMAFGNFYKICYKIDHNIPVQASEIFNFDDFMPYFVFQIYILVASLIFFVPFFLLTGFFKEGDTFIFSGIMICIFLIYFVLIYFLLQAFYIPALITFKKITDIKTAWNISKVMTKGNLLNILLFSIATSFLAQLGVLACFIGLIFTMPFYYVAHYFTCKDGLEQIEYDDITEIGQNY